MDEPNLKTYVDNVVVVPTDPDPLKKYKGEMEKAKRLILDVVRDHVVCHISGKDTSRQMWEVLATLYEGSSKQQNIYMEQKMRSTQMQNGDHIDPFLTRLQEIRDSLEVFGSTPQPIDMVRLALNYVSEEWKVFVQRILGRERFLDWEGMWVTLQQE